MSAYDDLLTADSRTSRYDELLAQDDADRKQALQGSLAVATQRNPDERAKVVELSQRTGIPVDTVSRRPLEARALASRGVDYDRLLTDSPRLADWMSDSENASVAHDDLKSLGNLEWLLKAPKAGLKQGSATVELSQLGVKAMNDGLTAQDEQRIRELNAVSVQPTGAENFFSKAYVGLFKTLPQVGTSVARGLEYGAAGAIAAGTTVAVAGQLGPQIAIPEEIVTVPAASLGGFRVGATFGAYQASRDLEAGSAFLEFRAIQDTTGKPIDPGVAKVAAIAVGEANAIIEVASLGVLVKSFPGSDVLLGSLTRENVKAALARPTVTAALGSLAKRFAGVWTAEVGQEVSQEAITILGSEIAKGTAEGEFKHATPGQVGERLGETAVTAAQEFAILSALGPTSSFTKDVVRVRRAKQNQEVFEALASNDSKLRARLPEKFREFVAKATEGGPVENVYIPAEKFAEYFQSQPDREEVLRKIPALGEQMEEALASGGDLAIPIADFAAYIAPSEHYAGLSQDLRLHPDDMTAREAGAWEKQSENMAKDVTAKADPSRAVYEDVLGQLLASGMEQGTAEKNATLMQSTFRSLGERSGQDPAELYKQYGLTIRRELPAGLKEKAQVDTTIDPLIDQLRAGKVPSEQDVFGQSLTQFLKSNGGLKDQGGELAARDTKKAAPGLVKSEGLAFDAAAELAVQAGYITERSDTALLSALDKELRGKPVYAAGHENQQLQEQRAALTDLDEFLSRAGIDLKSADNEAVKTLLRQVPASVAETELNQPAFHGSPHDFDKFSLDKLGTGEGNTAFGYGLYFAENPETADTYRRAGQPVYAGQQVASHAKTALERATTEGLKDAAARRFALEYLDQQARSAPTDARQQFYDAINNFDAIINQHPGRLYTVDIPDSAVAKMLDWDKPLGEQTAQVKSAMMEAVAEFFPDSQSEVRIVDGSPVKVRDLASELFLTRDNDRALHDDPSVARAIEKYADNPNDRVTRNRLNRYFREYPYDSDEFRNPLEALESQYGIETGSLYGMLANKLDPDRAKGQKLASEYLFSRGIPGIKFLDAVSRSDRDGTRNLVVFDDSIITITHKDGSPVSAAERKEFLQTFTEGKRGSIQFGKDRQFTINLFEKSDLTTLLHESGHFYLEVLGDLASKENAPQQIKDDYAAILKWMGVKDRSEIKVDQHEKFARGFEAYLMEGKAPSVDMQNVFARFRAWLTAIYRDAKRLNVELTAEVRAVFDRLVATEDEIAAAQESQNYVAIFTTAESAGMSPEAFAAYRQTVEAARIEAEESLSSKLLKDITREQKAWWKEERQKMRTEVETEVHSQPLYRALAFLQKGTNPDGSALEGVTPIKLSKEALVAQYGAEFLKRLPRPYVYTKGSGVAPEIVATMFGFGSGDELIQALVNARPMKQLIEGETDARMREKYGDALNDGQLAEEAMKAVHSDKRAELLAAELKALRRKQREVKPFVRASELAAARERRQSREANAGNLPNRDERKIIQRAAQRAIEGKRVRDISPALYRAAEAQAARKAFEAAGKDDFEVAYLEKRKQLLNHELYRAAMEARETIEKTVEYLRGFDKPAKRAALGKAGADYLEQIDGIRERFDFSRISNIGSQKRMALAEWVTKKQADGQEINLPPELLNESMRKPYKELTYGELQGIRDVVSNIDHLSRLKNKLLDRQDVAEYDAAVMEIVSSIEANHKRNPIAPDFAPSWGKRFKDGMKRLSAEHTKMEFLFNWLDGEKETGPIWRALFKPLADAETAEQTRMRDARQAMHQIFDKYTKAERAGWALNKTFIPEVGASFNKATLLSVALNVGNEYNKDVLLRGYQWTEAQLNVLLSKLDDKDWQTVQELWDFIDSFWPDIKALQKDLTGLEPDKVEAAPFVTTTGRVMKGGYYPIQYDSALSWRQQALEEEQSVQELYGGQFLRATTRQGHTKARTDSGGKAVKLDLGVMTGHVVNVIHDLTHRRALLDVDRLVTSNRVRQAIEETAGRQMYRQLRPWLRNIATDYRSPMTAPEAILNHARAGATIVNMGLKITTAIVQPLGYLNSIELLGAKYAAIGLRETFAKGDPFRSISRAREFAFERSEQLRNRMTTFDRDVRDQLKRLTETGYVGPIRRSFFFLTGFMDMSVAIPTWLGAYRKAMDGAVEEVQAVDEKAAIDFADSTLRKAQSAGGAKDLAGIQAGHPLLKLFTAFYSYFSVLYNLFARRVKMTDFTKPGDIAQFTASMFALWFAPAILSELLAGRGPGEDEPWEDYLKRTAYLWALYPAQSVVLLRDIASAMGPYGYDGSPALEAFEQTARAVKIPAKALDDNEDVSRSDVKAAILAASYWGHLPGRQAWITGSYLFDWTTGEEQPESVGDVAEGLAFSRRTQ